MALRHDFANFLHPFVSATSEGKTHTLTTSTKVSPRLKQETAKTAVFSPLHRQRKRFQLFMPFRCSVCKYEAKFHANAL
jgi:hypothetical protein